MSIFSASIAACHPASPILSTGMSSCSCDRRHSRVTIGMLLHSLLLSFPPASSLVPQFMSPYVILWSQMREWLLNNLFCDILKKTNIEPPWRDGIGKESRTELRNILKLHYKCSLFLRLWQRFLQWSLVTFPGGWSCFKSSLRSTYYLFRSSLGQCF